MSEPDPMQEYANVLHRNAELEAENERLRNTLYDGDDYKDGLKDGMERGAEIAESDTFAPPYGIRLAKAIRAAIPSTQPDSE